MVQGRSEFTLGPMSFCYLQCPMDRYFTTGYTHGNFQACLHYYRRVFQLYSHYKSKIYCFFIQYLYLKKPALSKFPSSPMDTFFNGRLTKLMSFGGRVWYINRKRQFKFHFLKNKNIHIGISLAFEEIRLCFGIPFTE